MRKGRSRVGLGMVLALAVGLGAPSDGAVLAQERAGLVVDAGWLAERMEAPELVVLQVGPEELYAREHVPGARFVSLSMIQAPMPDTGSPDTHLALELPAAGELRTTLERLGISDGSTVVVVPSDGWVTAATRVVFTLDYAGLGENTRFLDGGLEAWVAAGHPVTEAVPAVEPGRITAETAARVVDHEWVAEQAAEPGYALLDARPRAYYDGVDDDRGKVGHIPGAASVPWSDLVVDGAPMGEPVVLRPAEELRAIFRDAGVEADDTVVAYCHIGQYATAVLFAARTLGHEVRLYDGSMNEWAMLDLPVEAGGRDR